MHFRLKQNRYFSPNLSHPVMTTFWSQNPMPLPCKRKLWSQWRIWNVVFMNTFILAWNFFLSGITIIEDEWVTKFWNTNQPGPTKSFLKILRKRTRSVTGSITFFILQFASFPFLFQLNTADLCNFEGNISKQGKDTCPGFVKHPWRWDKK